MKNAHASSIKGLSIAVIILSALGILAAVLLMVFSGVLSAIIINEGPELMNDMRYEYGCLAGACRFGCSFAASVGLLQASSA